MLNLSFDYNETRLLCFETFGKLHPVVSGVCFMAGLLAFLGCVQFWRKINTQVFYLQAFQEIFR